MALQGKSKTIDARVTMYYIGCKAYFIIEEVA